MKTTTDIDWTPLAGITAHPNAQRGYSSFTKQEAERIRAFYFQSGAPARVIAEHFGVDIQVIQKCIHNQVKGVRRNITGKRKAEYWRNKARRMGTGSWVKEASNE